MKFVSVLIRTSAVFAALEAAVKDLEKEKNLVAKSTMADKEAYEDEIGDESRVKESEEEEEDEEDEMKIDLKAEEVNNESKASVKTSEDWTVKVRPQNPAFVRIKCLK